MSDTDKLITIMTNDLESINKKNGYFVCADYLVHRMVAETFIDNPDKKPTVVHINGDKTNNCVENLRCATRKEQMNNREHIKNSYINV